MTQTTFFDQATKARDEGIELVWQHADTHWKRAAGEQLQAVISSGRDFFTSDDVLIPLEERGIVTGDTRAIASLLLAARKLGLIETTDQFTTCRRKSRHNAPIRTWRVVSSAKGGAV